LKGNIVCIAVEIARVVYKAAMGGEKPPSASKLGASECKAKMSQLN
jgi:hypothetical protein